MRRSTAVSAASPAVVGAPALPMASGGSIATTGLLVSSRNAPMSAPIAPLPSGHDIGRPGVRAFAVISAAPVLLFHALPVRSLRDGLAVDGVGWPSTPSFPTALFNDES